MAHFKMEIEQGFVFFFLRKINFLKTMTHFEYIDNTGDNKLCLLGHHPDGTNVKILSWETEWSKALFVFSSLSLYVPRSKCTSEVDVCFFVLSMFLYFCLMNMHT